MTTPNTWRKRLGALIDLGHDQTTATDLLLAEVPAKDKAAVLRGLVLAEADRISRNRTHSRERQVAQRIAAGGDPIKARRKLAGDSFALPDGTSAEHLTASAEQHRLRAGWLRDHASGVLATASFHDDCADAIEAAGVTCLADLDPMLRPAAA